MSGPDPSSADFFEAKYQRAADSDPWQFATASYEVQRYEAIMQALNGRRYSRAFEPGCSVGVLTEQLATVCDQVDAYDFSLTAVAAAKARCAHLPGVAIHCEALSSDAPWASFELIVLSEIGYYFTAGDWRELIKAMVDQMQPGTVLLASHWLGTSADHVQTGAAVHAAIGDLLLRRTLLQQHPGFRLERWIRVSRDEEV